MNVLAQFLELPWEAKLAIAAGLSLLAFAGYLLAQLCLNPVVIPTIVLKSLRQHALSTAITAASIGLGCGLLMDVLVVSERSEAEFTNVTGGFDCLLGPRGSPTQLVLNSLFHIDSSPGQISTQD